MQPSTSGINAGRQCVISRQKRIAVSGTPSEPESIAPIPTRRPERLVFRRACRTCAASSPTAPPIISSGASTPPDVPDPSENAHISDFANSIPAIRAMRRISRAAARRYCRTPRPAPRGKNSPPTPIPMPPIAGHHIQCTGSRSNMSSNPYIIRLMPAAARPTTAPAASAQPQTHPVDSTRMPGIGKQRPSPKQIPPAQPRRHARNRHRNQAPRPQFKQQQLHRQQNRTPPAPQMSPTCPPPRPPPDSVVRSASVRWIHCATSEPNAPPVIMIGPSAPNGPPEPIAIAAEIGFSTAIFGCTSRRSAGSPRSPPGIPWPRILSDPKSRHQPNDQAADHRHHTIQ